MGSHKKPISFAEAESGLNPQPSDATLGTTPDPRCAIRRQIHATPLFSAMPDEILVNVMAHLDAVSQVCLGLTARAFHRAFHSVYGEGKRWNNKMYPFPLAMQASVCGQYILNWIWEDWFLRDAKDIEWAPSLGQLLWDEGIWGDLICCWQCLKYKPESAFGEFDFETRVLQKHRLRIARMEREEVDGYWNLCRRCRAKVLYACLEDRHVVYESGELWGDRKSLGLRRLEERDGVVYATTWDDWHALMHNYDKWEDIFAELDI